MKETFNECPHCGGTDLQRDIQGAWFNEEKQTLKLEAHCENCGDDFDEVYEFVRTEKL